MQSAIFLVSLCCLHPLGRTKLLACNSNWYIQNKQLQWVTQLVHVVLPGQSPLSYCLVVCVSHFNSMLTTISWAYYEIYLARGARQEAKSTRQSRVLSKCSLSAIVIIPIVHEKSSALTIIKCDIAEQVLSNSFTTFTLDTCVLMPPFSCSTISRVPSEEYRALAASLNLLYHT